MAHISDLVGTPYADPEVTFGEVVEGAVWVDRFSRNGPDGNPISFSGTSAVFAVKDRPDGTAVGAWTATPDGTVITVSATSTGATVDPATHVVGWREVWVELRVTLADARQVVLVGYPSRLRIKAAL